MSKSIATRRTFLRGAAGVSVALPFLSSLLPRNAVAANAPLRFVAIKSYSGQTLRDWYPTYTGDGYRSRDLVWDSKKLLPIDQPLPGQVGPTKNFRADGTTELTKEIVPGMPYRSAPLADLAKPSISKILGTGLNPYVQKLSLLRGVDFLPETNHNDGGMLGNFNASVANSAKELAAVPTIDQVIARSKAFYAQSPNLRSLHLSPGIANTFSFTNEGKEGGPVRQVQARTNPLLAFFDVFGAPVGKAGDDKLVDKVLADYKSLRSHPRLGASDKQQLEEHLSLLTELQGRLQTKVPQGCVLPAQPRSIANDRAGGNLAKVDDIKDTFKAMVDIVIAAIRCDITRVVTFDLRQAIGVIGGKSVGFYHGEDFPGSWHGAAHSWGQADADRTLLAINQWIATDVFTPIVKALDVAESAGRTFLDNSVVYWGNELGFNHINNSVPALLAGSAGGKLRTGQYLDYSDWQSRLFFGQYDGAVIQGLAHNRLLVTLLQAMGLQAADYERNGNPGYGAIETAGKPEGTFPTNYKNHGEVLPGLWA